MPASPARSRRASLRYRNLLESLESRLLLSALSPAAVRAAYGFDQLSNLTGAGQTIAIVDAYDAPAVAADLDVFDQKYGWASSGQTLYQQFGSASGTGSFFTKHTMTSSVKADGSWAQEIALDVEWAHAIAPGANILLVEAASSSLTDLFAAVNWAKTNGATVVSMSWGSNEFSSEASYDSTFAAPGVTFVASSGDAGGVISYPAISKNVVAVGGTTLNLANGTYSSETAWSGSGGGQSKIEAASAAQAAFTGSNKRTNPDVAYDADPNTGFAVYDSFSYKGSSGWLQFGGTSAGAPQWAGLFALANSGRTTNLDGVTQTIPAIYSVSASDFHDITSGRTGRSISAGKGYDQATGRGSPVANLLINDLIAYGGGSASAATAAAVTGDTSLLSVSLDPAVPNETAAAAAPAADAAGDAAPAASDAAQASAVIDSTTCDSPAKSTAALGLSERPGTETLRQAEADKSQWDKWDDKLLGLGM
jgi:subtilase family serine protease